MNVFCQYTYVNNRRDRSFTLIHKGRPIISQLFANKIHLWGCACYRCDYCEHPQLNRLQLSVFAEGVKPPATVYKP